MYSMAQDTGLPLTHKKLVTNSFTAVDADLNEKEMAIRRQPSVTLPPTPFVAGKYYVAHKEHAPLPSWPVPPSFYPRTDTEAVPPPIAAGIGPLTPRLGETRVAEALSASSKHREADGTVDAVSLPRTPSPLSDSAADLLSDSTTSSTRDLTSEFLALQPGQHTTITTNWPELLSPSASSGGLSPINSFSGPPLSLASFSSAQSINTTVPSPHPALAPEDPPSHPSSPSSTYTPFLPSETSASSTLSSLSTASETSSRRSKKVSFASHPTGPTVQHPAPDSLPTLPATTSSAVPTSHPKATTPADPESPTESSLGLPMPPITAPAPTRLLPRFLQPRPATTPSAPPSLNATQFQQPPHSAPPQATKFSYSITCDSDLPPAIKPSSHVSPKSSKSRSPKSRSNSTSPTSASLMPPTPTPHPLPTTGAATPTTPSSPHHLPLTMIKPHQSFPSSPAVTPLPTPPSSPTHLQLSAPSSSHSSPSATPPHTPTAPILRPVSLSATTLPRLTPFTPTRPHSFDLPATSHARPTPLTLSAPTDLQTPPPCLQSALGQTDAAANAAAAALASLQPAPCLSIPASAPSAPSSTSPSLAAYLQASESTTLAQREPSFLIPRPHSSSRALSPTLTPSSPNPMTPAPGLAPSPLATPTTATAIATTPKLKPRTKSSPNSGSRRRVSTRKVVLDSLIENGYQPSGCGWGSMMWDPFTAVSRCDDYEGLLGFEQAKSTTTTRTASRAAPSALSMFSAEDTAERQASSVEVAEVPVVAMDEAQGAEQVKRQQLNTAEFAPGCGCMGFRRRRC